MYLDRNAAGRSDVAHKRKAAAKRQKMCGLRAKALTYDRVELAAIQDHLKATCRPGVIYAFPPGQARLQTFSTALGEPETKKARADVAQDDDLPPDVDLDDGGDGFGSGSFYFRIVFKNLGHGKHVRPAPGAGGSIAADQMAVALHHVMTNHTDESEVISALATSATKASDMNFIFDKLSGDAATIRGGALMWEEGSKRFLWMLKGAMPHGCSHAEVSSVLTKMMDAKAYFLARKQGSLGMTAALEDLKVLEAFRESGMVMSIGEGDRRWYLTEQGQRAMTNVIELGEASQVFAIRSNIPVLQYTSFELMQTLREKGWTWQPWIAPSARKKKSKGTEPPLHYLPGGEKIWCSTGKAQRQHLLCLLQAEEPCLHTCFVCRAEEPCLHTCFVCRHRTLGSPTQ